MVDQRATRVPVTGSDHWAQRRRCRALHGRPGRRRRRGPGIHALAQPLMLGHWQFDAEMLHARMQPARALRPARPVRRSGYWRARPGCWAFRRILQDGPGEVLTGRQVRCRRLWRRFLGLLLRHRATTDADSAPRRTKFLRPRNWTGSRRRIARPAGSKSGRRGPGWRSAEPHFGAPRRVTGYDPSGRVGAA